MIASVDHAHLSRLAAQQSPPSFNGRKVWEWSLSYSSLYPLMKIHPRDDYVFLISIGPGFDHCYCAKSTDWGYSSFMKWKVRMHSCNTYDLLPININVYCMSIIGCHRHFQGISEVWYHHTASPLCCRQVHNVTNVDSVQGLFLTHMTFPLKVPSCVTAKVQFLPVLCVILTSRKEGKDSPTPSSVVTPSV